MSMISGLIDELNKSADEWNGSNMFELARMCREAVGIITELRGALHVASVDYRHLEAENAELKSLCRDMHGELVACEENGYVCGGHKFDERAEKLGVKS